MFIWRNRTYYIARSTPLRNMTHSYVQHDSFLYMTQRICYVQHDGSLCATWRISMRHITWSYVRHDAFLHETKCFLLCDLSHSCMRHDWILRATLIITACDMTHSFAHDSFLHAAWSIPMHDKTHFCICHDMTHFNICNDIFKCVSWRVPHSYVLLSPLSSIWGQSECIFVEREECSVRV